MNEISKKKKIKWIVIVSRMILKRDKSFDILNIYATKMALMLKNANML